MSCVTGVGCPAGAAWGPSGQDSGSTLRGKAGGWWGGAPWVTRGPQSTRFSSGVVVGGCSGNLPVLARPADPRPPGQLHPCTPVSAAAPLGTSPPPLTLALFSVRKVNDWQSDWVTFYARQRIQPQMELLEQGSGDREARELWAALQVSVAPCPRPPCAAGLREALRPV